MSESHTQLPNVNKGTGAGGANTNYYGKKFEEKTNNQQRLLEMGYTKHSFTNKAYDYYLHSKDLYKAMRKIGRYNNALSNIANVYNRLVLFDSKNIHAAINYFGDTKENSRFFHLFFFDI
jgi:hypothetical protein